MLVISLVLCFYLEHAVAVRSIGLFGFQRVCLCRCGISEYSSTSRTGRDPRELSVLPNEYPWLAAVHIESQVVAGSLISDRHVITAASPIYGLTSDRIVISLGAHDLCTNGPALNVTVEAITLYPGFSPTSMENDLALIKLKHVVAFSKYISPICLPVFESRHSALITWTVGWSQNNNSCTPQVDVLPSLPSSKCLKYNDNKLVHTDIGCLGSLGIKTGICKMGVGSPVMTRWYSTAAFRLIGVVSTSSCNVTSAPLFTRVNDHMGWIYEYIRRDCLCF